MRQLSQVSATGADRTAGVGPAAPDAAPAAAPSASLDHGFARVRCVDLDNGLIRTDVLIEQVLQLLKRRPLLLLLLPLWVWRGRAAFQHEIAKRQPVDAAALPYDPARLEQLAHLQRDGPPVSAVTALDPGWAEPVARHLCLAGPLITGSETVWLAGTARQARLDATFGNTGYEWVPPVAVPTGAGPSSSLPVRLRPYLTALRPHQWLKNALVFVPIVLAIKTVSALALVHGAIAFIAFSLTASSVYLLNDLTDLADDRRHPTKRRRPLASGLVPLHHGLALVPVLLGLAVGLSLMTLPPFFTVVLLIYYAATLAYSFGVKRTMLFDVITLAGLYTLRIIAGSAAVAIPRSFWLLAFSVFLFFSLALVKRYVEIKDIVDAATSHGDDKTVDTSKPVATGKLGGRGYRAVDLETLSQFGISSGLMAVLVLALYIDSGVVKSLYRTPELIWLLCPLMLYLICRFWILARRGEMHDDPIVFAVRDWRSQMIVLAGGLLLLVAAFV